MQAIAKRLVGFLSALGLALVVSSTVGAAASGRAGVDGRAGAWRERTFVERGHIHVGAQYVRVPSTHASVHSFKVKMPWGGHIVVPGVRVGSPRVAVSSPRIDLDVPFLHHRHEFRRRQAHR